LQVVAERLNRTAPEKIAAIVGDLAAAEEIKALKDLMRAFGVPISTAPGRRQDRRRAAPGLSFQHGFAGIEAADAILLIGTNPRWEAPVLNARIRKVWTGGNVRIANVGEAYDLTYPVQQIGRIAARAARDRRRHARFRPSAERRQTSDGDPGAGALARPDVRRFCILPSASPPRPDDRTRRNTRRRRLERIQCASRRGVARRRPRSRLRTRRERPRPCWNS